MNNYVEKMFQNEKLFYAMPFVYLVMAVIDDIAYGAEYTSVSDIFYYVVMSLAIFVAALGITISYKKHEKNVMKGLLGGVLLVYATDALSSGAYYAIVDREDMGYSVFGVVWAAIVVGITICHFMLSADHKAKPNTIKCNQFLLLLAFVIDALWYILDIVVYGYPLICAISECIMIFAMLFIVVAVEYRVDLFKQARQQGIEL